MIFIALKTKEGRKVGIKEIAQSIESPEHFIAKILQDLSRKKIVQSLKGPNGGFYVDEKSMKCSLADIVRTVDGDQLFTGCGLGLKQCSEIHPCPIHDQFKQVRKEIGLMLENAKIGTFSEELENSITFLKKP